MLLFTLYSQASQAYEETETFISNTRRENMKYLISLMVCCCLFLQGSTAPVSIQTGSTNSPSACTETCMMTEETPISTEISKEGNQIIKYESGVEVEYISENEWIIRDYPNVFEAEIPETQTRVNWIELGKAIMKFIGGVLSSCQAIEYLTGHDLCRIALSYLSSHPVNGTATYLVTGNYIPGYIPGCEPRNSLPCNSGYWEYRVVYQ